MGDDPGAVRLTLWHRLKRHFVEAFTISFLALESQQSTEDRQDAWQDRRRRGAYRYILLLIAAAVLPLVLYNIYVREIWSALATTGLLTLLLGNTLLLAADREALGSPQLVMGFAIATVVLAEVRGQHFGLFLLYPLMAGLPVMMRWRRAILLGVVSIAIMGYLVSTRLDGMTTVIVCLSLGLTWIVSAWLGFSLTEQTRRLRELAVTDPLTGAYNRRYFEQRASAALNNWLRHGRPASILLLDIDHFKRINDQFGHDTGDRALKTLVDLVSRRIRSVDSLFRLGGEEFVLLLSEATELRAERVANEIRMLIERSHLLPSGTMTISVGVCEAHRAGDIETWLKLADTALYQAKEGGRNRVVVASDAVGSLPAPALAKTIPDWR